MTQPLSHIGTAYGLRSMASFEALFDFDKNHATARATQEHAVEELGASAREGNLNSLELLIDVARGHTPAGTLAESILFDIFSLKNGASESLAQEVAQLTAMARDFIKPHEKFDKLNPPDESISKLLYMAGARGSRTDQVILTQQFSQKLDLGDNEVNLWDTNRLITGDELNADLYHQLLRQNPVEGFVVATSLASDFNKNAEPHWRFTPLLVDKHWVLLADRTAANGESEAVVFSSTELNEWENTLLQSVWPQGLTIVQALLQKHVPNGCGLFVRAARERLMHDEQAKANPVDGLKDIKNKLSGMTEAASKNFNLSGRRQMFGALIDDQNQMLNTFIARSGDVSTGPSSLKSGAFIDNLSQMSDDLIAVAQSVDDRAGPSSPKITPYRLSQPTGDIDDIDDIEDDSSSGTSLLAANTEHQAPLPRPRQIGGTSRFLEWLSPGSLVSLPRPF